MPRTLLLALAVGVAGLANAQLYTQNPHTPGATGGNGLSGFKGNLGVAGDNYDRQVADDFVVTGAGWSIDRIVSNWVQFTVGDPNPITQMNFDFYTSNGTSPTTLVTSRTGSITRSTGPGTYFGRPEQILDSSFAPVVLGPGSYFVMVQAQVDHNWFWLTSTPTTPIAGAPANSRSGPGRSGNADLTWNTNWLPTGPGNPIFVTASDQAYKIYGTVVPEPVTMLTLGLGAAALLRRRRKN